jgi:hypothetical protein
MIDHTKKSGRRQWMSKDGRDALVDRINSDLATGHETRASTPAFVTERIPEPVAAVAQAISDAPPKSRNGGSVSWHAVAVDPEEFPLAAALDDLDAKVMPALAALEAAGKIDAAGLLRAELDMTPVEAELLRLWRAARGD